jgi:hypothetical protein
MEKDDKERLKIESILTNLISQIRSGDKQALQEALSYLSGGGIPSSLLDKLNEAISEYFAMANLNGDLVSNADYSYFDYVPELKLYMEAVEKQIESYIEAMLHGVLDVRVAAAKKAESYRIPTEAIHASVARLEAEFAQKSASKNLSDKEAQKMLQDIADIKNKHAQLLVKDTRLKVIAKAIKNEHALTLETGEKEKIQDTPRAHEIKKAFDDNIVEITNRANNLVQSNLSSKATIGEVLRSEAEFQATIYNELSRKITNPVIDAQTHKAESQNTQPPSEVRNAIKSAYNVDADWDDIPAPTKAPSSRASTFAEKETERRNQKENNADKSVLR